MKIFYRINGEKALVQFYDKPFSWPPSVHTETALGLHCTCRCHGKSSADTVLTKKTTLRFYDAYLALDELESQMLTRWYHSKYRRDFAKYRCTYCIRIGLISFPMDNMADNLAHDIFKRTFFNKNDEFPISCHLTLFLRIQLTICQHWFW